MTSRNVVQNDETDEIRDYEQCGFQIGCGSCKLGRFPIPCLNVFNSSRWALFFFSISSFLQGGIVNGISSVVISTLERRFHLTSFETGFISSCYEVGVCVSIPVVTYIGGRGHKTLWIGWGMFIMGVGSIVFSLPHFIAASYILPSTNTTSSHTSLVSFARSFFILGQVLLGIGASPIYTIALNYLDENVKEVYSSTYHGIYFASALLGPGAGFLVGGYFLSLYVNLNEEVDITNESIFWIGNWWVGFIISGAMMVLFSFPVMLYPKQLPFTDKVRQNREKEMQNQRDAVAIRGDDKFGKSVRDFPLCLLIVLKNPILIFNSLSAAMDSGLVSAYSSFGTKYIETMFSLPSSTAALYFGATVVIFACSGNFLSGFFVTKFKMTVPKMIIFCIITTACSFCCVFVFLLYCPTPDIAGVNVPYNGEPQISCQSQCGGCSTGFFSPVCGADRLTYTSYCDASCQRGETAEDFNNCTRIAADQNHFINVNSTAITGKCKVAGCLSVGIFLTFGGLSVFFGYLKSQSGLQITLRSMPFYQRPFALGVQWLIMRLIGQIPLPIVLGKILDLSCIVWGEECGQCGACKMYDGPSMASSLTSLGAVVKAVSLISLLLTWKFYKPIKDATKTTFRNGNATYNEGIGNQLTANNSPIAAITNADTSNEETSQ